MFVLTPKEMAELDRITIEDLGIHQNILMENAGRTVFSILENEMDEPFDDLKAVVICGPGNNGGDGFVVARYLLEKVKKLSVYVLGDKAKYRGAALDNLSILEKLRDFKDFKLVFPDRMTGDIREDIQSADIVVDAIFGTGFKGKPEGIFWEFIDTINQTDGFVVAVDIPSGVNGYNGETGGIAVDADITVTMAFPKLGHFLYPGKLYSGELAIANIGIPEFLAKGKIKRFTIEEDELKSFFPLRFGPEHKGNLGRVLVIAGSVGFTGAATLASLASLRVGAGLTYLAIPESLNPILETKVTEVITIPVKEKNGAIIKESIDQLFEKDILYTCIAVGPGLTRSEQVKEALFHLLSMYDGPIVLDADAVVLLKDNLDILKGRGVPPILTPHPGELSYLVGLSPSEINRRRVEIAENFAKNEGVVLVLKGAPTVISSPEGCLWINTTGNPGLASGGTGDVLTGMIAGFLGQGLSPLKASLLGVYLHGLAGDIGAAELSMHSLMAGDLLDFIPEALNEFLEEEDED